MPAIVLPKQPPSRQGPTMAPGHFQLASWTDAEMKTGLDRLHRWATIIAIAAPLAGLVMLVAA